MDELIRELEKDRANARAKASQALDEETRAYWGGEANASFRHLSWAREAKRRMADREPAWTLEP